MKNENKKYIIVFIKVFPYQYMALPVYTKENVMSTYKNASTDFYNGWVFCLVDCSSDQLGRGYRMNFPSKKENNP